MFRAFHFGLVPIGAQDIKYVLFYKGLSNFPKSSLERFCFIKVFRCFGTTLVWKNRLDYQRIPGFLRIAIKEWCKDRKVIIIPLITFQSCSGPRILYHNL